MTPVDAAVILCVNCGSSSVKCAVYRLEDGNEARAASSSVEGNGSDALDRALAELAPLDDQLTGAGHRLVRGGASRDHPAVIDAGLLAVLQTAVPLAPLHLPAALRGIDAVTRRHPGLPQVACFDTTFHRGMPEASWRLPLPRALADAGIRRYGFHGLSYEYVVATLGADRLGRAVLAHLGNGASLAAVRDGRSLHTTMGFTPTGGILMGTRTGDLDPGVLVYLLRELGYDTDSVERLIDADSGLLGISARSADMQTLLADRQAGDERAALAVEMFCTGVRMQIGAYSALLGGLDTVVFTGGIGAGASVVRSETCRGLEHLGVEIDEGANRAGAPVVSSEGSSVTVRVLKTNEDIVIARHTRAVLDG